MRVFVRGRPRKCKWGARGAFLLVLGLLTMSSCAHLSGIEPETIDRSKSALVAASRMGVVRRGKLPKGLPSHCRLWSDWSQMCSHLGGGKWYCAQSAVQPVESSTSYCLDHSYGIDPDEFQRKQALESATRYCSESYSRTTQHLPGSTGGARTETREHCQIYLADRPFNGKRIAERRHPWCSEWTDSGSKEIVCSENDDGVGSCEELASINYESSNRLVCSNWNLPTRWCEEAGDHYSSPFVSWGPNEFVQRKILNEGREYVSFGPVIPPPVYGVSCRDSKFR